MVAEMVALRWRSGGGEVALGIDLATPSFATTRRWHGGFLKGWRETNFPLGMSYEESDLT